MEALIANEKGRVRKGFVSASQKIKFPGPLPVETNNSNSIPSLRVVLQSKMPPGKVMTDGKINVSLLMMREEPICKVLLHFPSPHSLVNGLASGPPRRQLVEEPLTKC